MSQIDSVLQRAVEAGAVPGVVAMAASGGELAYEGAFGWRSLAEDALVTRDTLFRIMSMTKALTSFAALQLVEQGRTGLDQTVASIIPAFGELPVLEGINEGRPQLRPARSQATIRQLFTHTAGFGYEIWSPGSRKYQKITGTPGLSSASYAGLRMPLLDDPGTRWQYGINIDWLGRVIEAVSGQPLADYFQAQIFDPLGMRDTSYQPTEAQRARLATLHARQADGSLSPMAYPEPVNPDFSTGGHGLFSTARDYMAFLQMLLNGGSLNGAQLLRPETVALMTSNQTGELDVAPMQSGVPSLSNDFELFPGVQKKHGLGVVVNTAPIPGMRTAYSGTWAGLFNTYFWFDPRSQVAGLILTQILPFADHQALALYADFERSVYEKMGSRR
jgi:methyl acetate hydrolase